MPASLSALVSNILVLVILVAVVALLLRVAQGIFRTDSKRAAAGEVAAKLVTLPAGSDGVLRRRFVRAVTGQHVVMPSGERLAFGSLVVRVAPEDLPRLDPDEDVDRLGADAARLYRTHAEREGWTVPDRLTVTVEVDPTLRAGWIPPARGGAAAPADPAPPVPGWDALATPVPPGAADDGGATTRFPALVREPEDPTGTRAVVPELCLARGGDVVDVPAGAVSVLGRLPGSLLPLDDAEVSFRHASVRLFRGEWQVKDLDSTNGTTLDGERLDPGTWATLRPGAVLALAGVRLEVTTRTHGTVRVEGMTTVP